MKQRKISKTNVVNFSTYLGMVIFFLVMTALSKAGVLNRSMTGLLVPICCYMSMAVSLNLTVGILGELSLGHAGFMSVGAFAGVIASQSLLDVVPSAGLRLTILPEALREFADYRMLVYAIVLILVMLATHNPTLQSFFARLKPGKKEEKEAA